MKVLKWVAGIFVVLLIIGAVFGEDEKSSDGKAATGDLTAVEENPEDTATEVVEATTPEPTPEPLEVSVSGPE